MASNPRVFELLEEMLNSGRTPEDVCADCPELLPEVRRRWQTFRLIDEEMAALLPDSDTRRDPDRGRPPANTGELPQIPNYRVDGVLGSGGMGIVYRAWDLRLDRLVALKMLLAGAQARPTELERFLREAQAVAALRHPNIVQVYDVGEVRGRPYFTMEFVEGGNLAETIQGNPQPASKAAAIVAILADAIHVAHQSGIVHRDLKPSNVLLATDGTPKVTDFGLARRLEGDGELTLSGTPMGTPSYMAPEQARGDKNAVGPATDVYALGAILYELVTGRPPFRAETPTATLHQVMTDDPVPPARLNPRLPRDLETLCLKCLHKDPQRRYASAAALAEDLHRFERGEPIKARRVGPIERGVRWARRRPALAGALAIGMFLTCALIVTILWWYGQRMALEASAIAYAEADLNESERLRDNVEFMASAEVLRRAKDRLRDFVPPELHNRLLSAFDNLELVTLLDAIRLERAFHNNRIYLGASTVEEQGVESMAARRYDEAFRQAGLGTAAEDPIVVAVRVRASPVRAFLVAALDDWSLCALDRDRRNWVLAVARGADPDPWRDRVRDPTTWEDGNALMELADQAPLSGPSPHLLVALAARLRHKKGFRDNVPPAFLTRVALAHPRDFWVNVEMGYAAQGRSRWEAIGYFKTALAIRLGVAPLHFQLGAEYMDLRRPTEAVHHLEEAVRLDPDVPLYQNLLGLLLRDAGLGDKAIIYFKEAERLDPHNKLFWHNLDTTLLAEGRIRQALRLVSLGRGEAVRVAWEKRLAAADPDPEEWFGYAELCLFLGLKDEYHKARLALLGHFGATPNPAVGERVARACLLLPALEDELRQANELANSAVAAQNANPFYLFTQGLSRYRQSRFDDAIKLMNGGAAPALGPCPRLVLAMAQYQKGQKDQARKTLADAITSYDWSTLKADNHDAWIAHILRREAEALILRDRRD